MRALTKKRGRDLWDLRGPAAAIALVLGTAFCYSYVEALQTEFFRIPFVLTRSS